MEDENESGDWKFSGEGIAMGDIDGLLYLSDNVKDFLKGKSFIVAEKGIGKTLLLKKKKKDTLALGNVITIPPDEGSDLDTPSGLDGMTKKQKAFFAQRKNAEDFWSMAIQLSAVKRSLSAHSDSERVKEMQRLPASFQKLLADRSVRTPCEMFRKLVEKYLETRNNIKTSREIVNSLFEGIGVRIDIFIDSLDQNILPEKGFKKDTWVEIQLGLLEAAWNLKKKNKRIHTFCSIRKEAYDCYKGQLKSNIDDVLCILTYDSKDLYGLINKLSNFFGHVGSVEELIGFGGNGTFVHAKTGRSESVFDYILRHTVNRPRDLIRIARELKNLADGTTTETEKEEKLRKKTMEKTTEITNEIFSEKANFLDCLEDETNRDRFLSLIPKNALSRETVKGICREFNGRNEDYCTPERCLDKKSPEACGHPFCVLFGIGLFGYVDQYNEKQMFSDGVRKKQLLMSSRYFVVHPGLRGIISELRSAERNYGYVITPGLIIGDDCDWKNTEKALTDLVDWVLNECDSKFVCDDSSAKLRDDLLDTIKDGSKDKIAAGIPSSEWMPGLRTELENVLSSRVKGWSAV
jgi:hypothetical protein